MCVGTRCNRAPARVCHDNDIEVVKIGIFFKFMNGTENGLLDFWIFGLWRGYGVSTRCNCAPVGVLVLLFRYPMKTVFYQSKIFYFNRLLFGGNENRITFNSSF